MRTVARMRIGRRGGIRKRNLFFIVTVLFLVFTIQAFWYIETKIEPVLRDYAAIKIKQIATDAINDAISKKIVENKQFINLFHKTLDQSGRIQSLSLDVKEASRVQAEATLHVRNTLEELSSQAILIPLGVALNSNILATYGPNIPISMVPIGAVEVDLNHSLEQKGINMVLINSIISIKTTVKVVIPFSSDEANIEQDVVIASELIVGEVPKYFFNSETGEAERFQVIPPPPIEMSP